MDIAEPELAQSAPTSAQQDRYTVESTLGAGGMGIVYLAHDNKLDRPVAIKKLREDTTSTSARARIRQEAQLLAKLNHPHIVQLFDVLEENGNIALVMEFVDGTTLKEWMREHTPGLQQKLNLLMQICQGLNEAHSLGIIHRDLKADNILITGGNSAQGAGKLTAKITDFGIAKSQQIQEQTLTEENQVAGTVSAMSPEQVQGRTLDPRSDLFSLGTIAYELLCGARPFEKSEGGSLALANRIVSEPHIPPQQTWANIPEPLAILLDKLLSKEASQRPESAQLVSQAFELLHRQGLDAEPEEFTATLTSLFTRQHVQNRRRWQRIAGTVLAVLVLSGAGYKGWEYFTRLEPQYIAVMPVEINGEIRGEENAKALTKTMVRQALMNSVSQLKASALVSFIPKDSDDFDAQLQALRDKGITDALVAYLDCAHVRCEIRIERLAPLTSEITQQTSFTFLTDTRQQSEYRITDSTANLFARNYQKNANKQSLMADKDYDAYLDIVARLESKDLQEIDLQTLERLTHDYPDNLNLYSTHTNVSTNLFVLKNNPKFIHSGLAMLERAKLNGIRENQLFELEVWLNTYSTDNQQFESLLPRFKAMDLPSAALLSKYARFLFTKGQYDAGLKYAKQAADLHPSADNLYMTAANQTAVGNYTKARSTLTSIIALFPHHWSSYSLLSVIEFENGNYFAAENYINAIPQNLRGWRTLSNLGSAYFLQQKYSESLATHQQVLEIVPDDIATISLIAETLLMLGEQEKANRKFLQLKQLTDRKEGLENKMYHALALANLGEFAMAIPLIHQLLQESANDTYVKLAAAQVYALAGEVQSANYYIEQLLQQGMSADWFRLPAFRQLCTQNEKSENVLAAICD